MEQTATFAACLLLQATAVVSASTHLNMLSVVGDLQPSGEHSTTRSLKGTVSSKVVGGRTVRPGSYPFVTSLRRPQNSKSPGTHFCGGALIAENVVATAAHCLDSIRGRFPVHVGRHDRNGMDMGRFETFTVVRSIVHPLYGKGADLNYDIALLVLNGKSSKRPVELRTSDVCFEGAGCGYGEVFGWGWTEANGGDSAAKELVSVRLPLVSRSTCRQHYGFSRITNAMVCAGGSAGEDSCQGDSGGPLLVINKLSGLVSFGAAHCGSKHPGVYTNMALVGSWVRNKLREVAQGTRASSRPRPQQSQLACRYINGAWYPTGC